jgi:hypothetical protein
MVPALRPGVNLGRAESLVLRFARVRMASHDVSEPACLKPIPDEVGEASRSIGQGRKFGSGRLRIRWAAVLGGLLLFAALPGRASGVDPDPLAQWSVPDGYSLRIVASGFSLPTAIAVVQDPRPDPKAPMLFITELRGAIKIVANDGSVTTFAQIPTFKPDAEWPDNSGEAGMAGVCLDQKRGYVFATYAYRDPMGLLRNGMTRFTATPQTFEGTASDRQDYLDLFKADNSAFSHQIGNCVVSDDSVYLSVGDGGDPVSSRSLEKLLGKVLRLTLDGRPYPTNPFAASGGRAANIYAYGLRNPFGLTVVDGRVFASENGVGLDRFLEIQEGRDYAWDGTDASIATNAAVVFSPTICPVQVAYAPPEQTVLDPKPNARFLIAISDAKETGPGVMCVEYDLKRNMVVGSPKIMAHLEGSSRGQGVVGLALSREGLYFTPILPVGGTGVLMMMKYDPAHAHSSVIGAGSGPAAMISSLGCLKCHSLDGVGGTQGPGLDKNSLTTRVESRVLDPSYAKLVARLDAIPDETVRQGSGARKEVLSADPNDRVKLWVVNRLLYPKFDEPNAQMPDLKLTREKAEAIATYLLHESPKRSPLEILLSRRFLAGVGLGLVFGLGFAGVLVIRSSRRRRA